MTPLSTASYRPVGSVPAEQPAHRRRSRLLEAAAQLIYALYGGTSGLADALYAEGFSPRRETRAQGRLRTLGQVILEVQACFDAGTLVERGSTAEELARRCWLSCHGLAALELGGLLGVDDNEAFAEGSLHAPLAAHLP